VLDDSSSRAIFLIFLMTPKEIHVFKGSISHEICRHSVSNIFVQKVKKIIPFGDILTYNKLILKNMHLVKMD